MKPTRTRRLPHRGAAVSLGVLLAALVTTVAATPADATPGTWGAGAYSYFDGEVCNSGTPSSASAGTPYVSWNFGTGSPAYLLSRVTSDGTTDSSSLPTGAGTTYGITAGSNGFTSSGDIATYAALIDHYGRSGTQHVAEIAQAIMAKSSGSAVSCVPGGDIDSLLASAAQLAGPYSVQVTGGSATLGSGATGTATATITSASGNAVPNATVSFSGDVKFTTATAVTNSAGVASAKFSVPSSSLAAAMNIQASVSVAVGLTHLSGAAGVTSTNPSGTAASAVYLSPPQATTGTAQVSIDQSAHPVIAAALTSQIAAVGTAVQPRAKVTGLNGHSGTATLTVYGPQPIPDGALCGAPTAWDASAPSVASSTVNVSGDGVVNATPVAISAVGCYFERATITTTDATPTATADSGFTAAPAELSVINPTAALTLQHPIVGVSSAVPTAVAGVAVAGTRGLPGTVTGVLLGPATGSLLSCSGASFAQAPKSAPVNVATTGDQSVTLTSPAVTAIGCYQWQASFTLRSPSAGSTTIGALSASGDGVISAVKPTITEQVDQLWSSTPGTVGTHVQVLGTLGMPAHAETQMMYRPADPLGCGHADWSKATLVATGTSVPVATDGSSVAVPSGSTPKSGCYVPVARLTMDGDPSLSYLSSLDSHYNALIAAGDATSGLLLAGGAVGHGKPLRLSLVVLAGGGGVVLFAVVFVLVLARRGRYRDGAATRGFLPVQRSDTSSAAVDPSSAAFGPAPEDRPGPTIESRDAAMLRARAAIAAARDSVPGSAPVRVPVPVPVATRFPARPVAAEEPDPELDRPTPTVQRWRTRV